MSILVYDPIIHKSQQPHPKSGEHKRYFVYKEGKCYAEGLCLGNLTTFVRLKHDSLDIHNTNPIANHNVVGILKTNEYVVETITATRESILEDWKQSIEDAETRYKRDLRHTMLPQYGSVSIFADAYVLAEQLYKGDSNTPIDFAYEQPNHKELHIEFEAHLSNVISIVKNTIEIFIK